MIVKTLLLYELFQLILHGKEEIGLKGLAVFLAYKKALAIGVGDEVKMFYCTAIKLFTVVITYVVL